MLKYMLYWRYLNWKDTSNWNTGSSWCIELSNITFLAGRYTLVTNITILLNTSINFDKSQCVHCLGVEQI